MPALTRRGWTLHEMLISLCVLGTVMGLAAHAATTQLRAFGAAADLSALRTQTNHASAIPARVLWNATAADLIVAQDSALELQMSTGASFVCESSPGFVTFAAAADRGNTLASFTETPAAGDRVLALFEDSAGATWLGLHVAEAPQTTGPCRQFPEERETRTMRLMEPITVPAGVPLRFTRPVRFSLYRGADSRWYLGMRDWNVDAQRLNVVQPVAGPLSPYSVSPTQTGLRFVYRDGSGAELLEPVSTSRVASVAVVARATSAGIEDTTAVVVALRNAP